MGVIPSGGDNLTLVKVGVRFWGLGASIATRKSEVRSQKLEVRSFDW